MEYCSYCDKLTEKRDYCSELCRKKAQDWARIPAYYFDCKSVSGKPLNRAC